VLLAQKGRKKIEREREQSYCKNNTTQCARGSTNGVHTDKLPLGLVSKKCRYATAQFFIKEGSETYMTYVLPLLKNSLTAIITPFGTFLPNDIIVRET
jgi:hypothetical protein